MVFILFFCFFVFTLKPHITNISMTFDLFVKWIFDHLNSVTVVVWSVFRIKNIPVCRSIPSNTISTNGPWICAKRTAAGKMLWWHEENENNCHPKKKIDEYFKIVNSFTNFWSIFCYIKVCRMNFPLKTKAHTQHK